MSSCQNENYAYQCNDEEKEQGFHFPQCIFQLPKSKSCELKRVLSTRISDGISYTKKETILFIMIIHIYKDLSTEISIIRYTYFKSKHYIKTM